MSITPCVGREQLYDLALFSTDAPAADRQQAVHRAAALCATCPTQCGQPVTVDSEPAPLVLLEHGWMPPTREGKPGPKPRAERRHDRPAYVPPQQRVEAWAAMAAWRASRGCSVADIAEALLVSEDTAVRLIELGRSGVRGAA